MERYVKKPKTLKISDKYGHPLIEDIKKFWPDCEIDHNLPFDITIKNIPVKSFSHTNPNGSLKLDYKQRLAFNPDKQHFFVISESRLDEYIKVH